MRKTEHETNPCQAQALNVQVLACVPETSRKMHSNIIPLKRVFFYKVSVGDGPGFKSSPPCSDPGPHFYAENTVSIIFSTLRFLIPLQIEFGFQHPPVSAVNHDADAGSKMNLAIESNQHLLRALECETL